MKEIALHWIGQYGYAGILSLLIFGIVGLPVPDEWLLTFSGFLVFKRTLLFVPTFAAAFCGSACGITVSYALGRIFDTYVLVKYGSYIHMTPDRLARVHSWFERRCRWTLPVVYFVPGVRHLTGYIAGASELSFSNFALFAYTGAFCWAAIFITLGYILGGEWNRGFQSLDETQILMIALVATAVTAWSVFSYLRMRNKSAISAH